jgi:alpha-N-arabinofuranosidase
VGTGTLTDALAWLEYTNGTRNTYLANPRRKRNGKDEPYNVKLRALVTRCTVGQLFPGYSASFFNTDNLGIWQIGQLSAQEYSAKAHQWAHALKSMDPSIQLVSCGEIGKSSWDYTVLQNSYRG